MTWRASRVPFVPGCSISIRHNNPAPLGVVYHHPARSQFFRSEIPGMCRPLKSHFALKNPVNRA